MGLKGYIRSVAESLRTACMVMVLIAGSQVWGRFLAGTKISMPAAGWIISLPFAPWISIILIGLVYLMAINVFVVRNITQQPFSVIFSGVYPFLLSRVVTAALLFVFQQIVTFLPNGLMK